MVTVEELLQAGQQEGKRVFRIAKVTALFDDGYAKVRYAGEETESHKKYAIVSTYIPVIGDTVLMAVFLETYIILGKLIYEEPPGGGEVPVAYVTSEQLADTLSNYTTLQEFNERTSNLVTSEELNSALSGCALSSHTHYYLRSGGYSVGLGYQYVNGVPCFSSNKNSDVNLGYSGSYRWKQLYATTSEISTSDARQKNTIIDMTEGYQELFRQLKPKRYKLNSGESDRFHVGFIAQDIEDALIESGLTSKDFAGFIKGEMKEVNVETGTYEKAGEFEYGLRYSEFIALNTWMIQILLERVEQLERRDGHD